MKTTIAKSFSLVLAAILLLTVSFSALAEESTSVAIDKEAFDALIASGEGRRYPYLLPVQPA